MIHRDKILADINAYLNISAAPEHNGLQVEGAPDIRKIVFGVSASMALFEAAAKAGADMILTHHGLVWDEAMPITGVFGRRAGFLLKNNINLAAYHLPLDMHPVIGNNAMLAKKLGLKNIKPFGEYHGKMIGLRGSFARPVSVRGLAKELGGECISTPDAKAKTAAIVSGGAHRMLSQAERAGVDLYITGSRDEFVVEYCKEAKINFIAMGHYNSEKLGIMALKNYVSKKFRVAAEFVDIPNPF